MFVMSFGPMVYRAGYFLIFLVPPYGGYGGCDGVSHSVQGMVIINCLIPPYSVNGRFMLSFER